MLKRHFMRINNFRPNTMGIKLSIVTIAFILFLSVISPVFADLSVGVKKGDWIEYTVTYTGNPSQGHDINFARMEVTNVQGTAISVVINSRYSNGSTEIFNSTLDLKTGRLIDDFIIPSNLKVGNTFPDKTSVTSQSALFTRKFMQVLYVRFYLDPRIRVLTFGTKSLE
jgi:hypothetical protein